MKVIHIADFDYIKRTGIGEVVLRLKMEQSLLGEDIYLFLIKANIQNKLGQNEFYVENLFAFYEKIKFIKPDLVVFHSLYKLPYICFSLLLNLKGIPYLIQPHGGMTNENAQKSSVKKKIANFFFYNSFVKRSKAIVYLNNNEKDKSIFSNIQKSFFVQANGIDEVQEIKRTYGKSIINICFIARIDIHHKGIDLLLDALKLIDKKQYKDKFELDFYGYGLDSDISYLKSQIQEIGLNVYYKGFVSGEDKDNVYMNSDICILTSRYEGMPMTILEALSFGLPCLVTPSTNMSEIINDYECGWVTECNASSIAHSIINAIDLYPTNRDKYQKNARLAVKKFNWKSIASCSISNYRKIV